MKNSLGLHSRCELEKERIHKLKGRSIMIIQSEELKEKRMKNKIEPQKLIGHHQTYKHGIPKRKEERKRRYLNI